MKLQEFSRVKIFNSKTQNFNMLSVQCDNKTSLGLPGKFMKELLYTRSVLEEFQDWCKLNADFLILDQALHMIII